MGDAQGYVPVPTTPPQGAGFAPGHPAQTPPAEKSLRPLQSFGRFLLAVIYFLVARIFALHGAIGLVPRPWVPVVEQAMLVFLLLLIEGLAWAWAKGILTWA